MTKQSNKKRSKKYGNGRTFQTRDEYFWGQEHYLKPDSEGRGNYRKVVVIDSNDLDELAVVKLTTSNKGIVLSYSNGKSKFRPYVITEDNEGKPIKAGRKFIPNSPHKSVSKKDVTIIKKTSFTDASQGRKNKARVRKMKKRQ